MATFEDLKESAEKFADTIEKICDNEDYDYDDMIEHILENSDSFKRYLDDVEETQTGQELIEDIFDDLDDEDCDGECDECDDPCYDEEDEEIPERTITPGYSGGSPVSFRLVENYNLVTDPNYRMRIYTGEVR